MAAPFLLTAELLPDITSRIINISSISLADEMDWGNLQGEQEYGRVGHQAYALSKLALNMWSYQLAARLHRAHHPAVAHLVDPGAVATKASSKATAVWCVHMAPSRFSLVDSWADALPACLPARPPAPADSAGGMG